MTDKFRISCLDNDSVKIFNSFWGEHGLSFLVERDDRMILFDAGTTAAVMDHNLRLFEKDQSGVSHIVLSHAHYDHTGGLDWVLDQTQNPILVADPDLYLERISSRDGQIKPTGIPVKKEKVESRSQVVITTELCRIGEGITVTGRIPRLNPYEKGNPKMLIRRGGELETDNFIDDRSLVLEVEDGLVVLLGCCHAGLINTLVYVKERFSAPIKAVIGGTHLLEASPEQLAWTIGELKEKFQPEQMFLNHCTGFNAMVAFRNALGSKLHEMPAGEVLEF
jgi:7,8-dihydropterin-6-yl-methyl-4-(beta-D-ribofuranosyl)aminobenzene 5'-phosphate synthase